MWTIHGSHRESKIGLQRLAKWVFAWILKKINSERKRVWPNTEPRSQGLVVLINLKDITRVENPSNLLYIVLRVDLEILGSKREDRLSDPFFELVQNTTLVRFSYLLRLCNFWKTPWDLRKFPQKCQKIAGCWGRAVYVNNFQSLRHLAHLSGTTGSRQYHESTMVWRNVLLYHFLKCLLLLCHDLFVEKGKTKY